MNDPHQEFDFYMRRWQVRLFIAGFVLPPLLFVLMAFLLRAEADGSAMACAIVAASSLITAGLIHGWRTAAAEKVAKARRKLRKAEAAAEMGR